MFHVEHYLSLLDSIKNFIINNHYFFKVAIFCGKVTKILNTIKKGLLILLFEILYNLIKIFILYSSEIMIY